MITIRDLYESDRWCLSCGRNGEDVKEILIGRNNGIVTCIALCKECMKGLKDKIERSVEECML